jgi:hypothetical protein
MRTPAQTMSEVKMSLVDSMASATSAAELPKTPAIALIAASAALTMMPRATARRPTERVVVVGGDAGGGRAEAITVVAEGHRDGTAPDIRMPVALYRDRP